MNLKQSGVCQWYTITTKTLHGPFGWTASGRINNAISNLEPVVEPRFGIKFIVVSVEFW